MSVTAARGFVASGVHAGIRRSGPDLAVVRSTARAVGAAVWTTNRVLAAPVVVSKRHLDAAEPQAVVINAGVANAATGERRASRTPSARLRRPRRALGLRQEEIVVLSTGVIGVPLPMDRVLAGVREASAALCSRRRRATPRPRSSRPTAGRSRPRSRATGSSSAGWRRAQG